MICAVSMPKERSFDRWQEVDAVARRLGYVALGIGSYERLEGLRQHLGLVESWDPEHALISATSLDLNAWFAGRERDLLEDGGELPIGEWRDREGPPPTGLWFPFENGVHLDPWWMALVPASEPWRVPLSLAYGNWNDCPDAIVHAAVCRHWKDVYEADLVAVGPDTLEFLVGAPPSTRDEAMALALEQYFYCPDIVDQGVETISALAASLVGNGTWSFWWD